MSLSDHCGGGMPDTKNEQNIVAEAEFLRLLRMMTREELERLYREGCGTGADACEKGADQL